jgi:hypothetical protein
MYGEGVCASYAGNMCLLLGMVDVECIFVTGIGQSKNGLSSLHTWNKVKIDGMWYNFDVAWDDPTPDKPGEVSYAYFGMTDAAFSEDHIWNKDAYPAAYSRFYNYYGYNGLLSHDYMQFKAITTQEITKQKRNREINIRLHVENYDPKLYDLSYIFDSLSGVEKARYSKPSGAYGEFMLNIQKKDGKMPAAPYLSTASDWARTGVAEAYGKGFIPAEIQNTYQIGINRQEFCRMAVRMAEYVAGKPIDDILADRGLIRNPNAFSDTADPDVLAAHALIITTGTAAPTSTTRGVFSPYGEITCEQAVLMIVNTCRATGADIVYPPLAALADIDITKVLLDLAKEGANYSNYKPLKAFTREQSIVAFNNIRLGGQVM